MSTKVKIARVTNEDMVMQSFTCCLCGQEVAGYGNNPAPLSDHGSCCDDCNFTKVVPTRILGIVRYHNT